MRLTARTLRRRKVGRQGHERFCLVGALALVAFLVVGWLTLAAYISLTAWPMSRQQHSTLDNHTPSLRQAFDSDPNPYFGWQPFTAQNMECSWRKCFKEEHQCTTCRDSSEDWGPAPPMSADWIPDVTLLHRMRLAGHDAQGRPWPPTLSDELCEQIGPFGGTNDPNKELLDQIPIVLHPDGDPEAGPKMLCMVYTMEAKHATNIRGLRETWASRCDGFLAFSTASDPRIPAISLKHDGPEEYRNMWQKTRSIWKFVGTHYIEDFDWFYLGGEDMFVIPENLRFYLSTLNPSEDHFVGRRFKGYDGTYFNSGGSGYVITRSVLRKYVTEGWEKPECYPSAHTSTEDVMLAKCLSRLFGIGLTDTRDELGRERFHPFSPGTHLYWQPPKPGGSDWYYDYNREWGVKLGKDCCAPDSVAFHYIKKPAMMRHLFALVYQCSGSRRWTVR